MIRSKSYLDNLLVRHYWFLIFFTLNAIGGVPTKLTSEQGLARLMAGNHRYTNNNLVNCTNTSFYRAQTTESQSPFAIILGCADSRAPVEVLFDQNIGDLFVVRVAGNVLGQAVLGSIEYAVSQLKVPLIMVLGHERCGAVKAAIESTHAHGSVDYIIKAIQPAVRKARKLPGDLLSHAVEENVRLTAQTLAKRKAFAPLIKAGKLKIVGAHYDLQNGIVSMIEVK